MAGNKFSLPDHDEEDELTHMGRALADDDVEAVSLLLAIIAAAFTDGCLAIVHAVHTLWGSFLLLPFQQDGRPDLDDEDEGGLDDAIVRDFHFGGGFVPKKRAEGEEDAKAGEDEMPERRKSKKEVSVVCRLRLLFRAPSALRHSLHERFSA